MIEIIYKPQVYKQLKKLPRPEKKKVIKKLELLACSPRSGKKLGGKLQEFYSMKAWPYRIIYTLEKSQIVVYSVAHRQSTYR